MFSQPLDAKKADFNIREDNEPAEDNEQQKVIEDDGIEKEKEIADGDQMDEMERRIEEANQEYAYLLREKVPGQLGELASYLASYSLVQRGLDPASRRAKKKRRSSTPTGVMLTSDQVINTIKLKEQREAEKQGKKSDKEESNCTVRKLLAKEGILPPEKVSMRTPLLMHEIDKFGQHFGISVALELHKRKEDKLQYIQNFIKEKNLLN